MAPIQRLESLSPEGQPIRAESSAGGTSPSLERDRLPRGAREFPPEAAPPVRPSPGAPPDVPSEHIPLNPLKLRIVYRKLVELSQPRSILMVRILSSSGPLNVTQLEREMYHAGDTAVTQTVVSNTINILRRHKVIRRVHIDGADLRHRYYHIHRRELRRIHKALERFSAASRSVHSNVRGMHS